MKKRILKKIYLVFAASYLLINQNAEAQLDQTDCFYDESTPYFYNSQDCYDFEHEGNPMRGYSISREGEAEMSYPRAQYQQQQSSYRSPYFSQLSDDNFNAGMSSYQGTSTGPGPNGGYPGAPRGTYKTNYYKPNAHGYQRINLPQQSIPK